MRLSSSILSEVTGILLGGGILLLLSLSCGDAKVSTDEGTASDMLKVATYNLWCSHSRNKHLENDSPAAVGRYWNQSSSAMLEAIREMDCDVFAFQEIGDSIYGKAGYDTSLRHLMELENLGYTWKIWSNVDGTPVTPDAGKLSYSPGICYRESAVTLLDGGVFWLGGNPSRPEFVRTESFDPEYGDPKRACVWARMRHKASGRRFYFLSAHLDTRSFSGVSYPIVNETNCMNLMAHADRSVVPEGLPSIIAGDMNTGASGKGYSILTDSQGRRHLWQDAYELAAQAGVLGETAEKLPVTTNSAKGDMGSSRIDHVFVEGFDVSHYDINHKKYMTDTGTEHYPSDHFPVIVTLKFK